MEYRYFKNTGDIVTEGSKLLREHMQMLCAGPHAVMLSGGKTPLPIYESVAGKPFRASANLYVMMSDERMVRRDSQENNLANAGRMLTALDLPVSRILAVNTAVSCEKAAMLYNNAIFDFFARGGRLTLAILGIGTDGHTASLFSTANLEAATGRYAIPVSRGVPPDRVSTTPLTIKRAERIVFLAAGKEKEEIVRQLRSSPGSVIAGRVVENISNVEIWCTREGIK